MVITGRKFNQEPAIGVSFGFDMSDARLGGSGRSVFASDEQFRYIYMAETGNVDVYVCSVPVLGVACVCQCLSFAEWISLRFGITPISVGFTGGLLTRLFVQDYLCTQYGGKGHNIPKILTDATDT